MDQESKVFIKTEKPVEQVVKKDSSISIKKSRMFTKKLKTLMINKKKKISSCQMVQGIDKSYI